MKRIYKVNIINHNNEIKETLEAKNIKEVKNIIKALYNISLYTVTKNDKLIKRLSSKAALKIITEQTNIW